MQSAKIRRTTQHTALIPDIALISGIPLAHDPVVPVIILCKIFFPVIFICMIHQQTALLPQKLLDPLLKFNPP